MKRIAKDKFKIFIKTLLDLENLFIKYNQKSESQINAKDFGYLIDKNYFDNFKNKIYYSMFKPLINDNNKFKMKLNELYGNNKEIAFTPCEQKIFGTSRDLLSSLFKNNEYVIINILVWKIINNGKYNENEGKINYEIKDNKIILFFGNEDYVYFKYNQNIIINQNLFSRSGEKTKVTSQVENHRNNDAEFPTKLAIIEFVQIYPLFIKLNYKLIN